LKNVIILGPGRTGSSFLAGFIALNRYYINQESIKDRLGYPSGDYENPDLVGMNKNIFFESGYGHHKVRYDRPVNILSIKKLAENRDIEKYRNFIGLCEQNLPWLWKDPRLCYTMYFWKYLLNLENIRFIFITRDRYQIFRSYTKYKVFFTRQDVYRKYDAQVNAIEEFFTANNIKPLKMVYEELWNKDTLIEKLNQFLGTDIGTEDYTAVHRTGITKKETESRFWIRYGIGLAKLKLQRSFEKFQTTP